MLSRISARNLIGIAGAVVLVGCAGQASPDPCSQASQHVAQCLGQSFTPQGQPSCSPETAAAILGSTCEQIQSQYGERGTQGFSMNQFLCEVLRLCFDGDSCFEGNCGCGYDGCEEPWYEEQGNCPHWHAECYGCKPFMHQDCHHDRTRWSWFKDCETCPWEYTGEGWDNEEHGYYDDGGCCHMHSNGPGWPTLEHGGCHSDKYEWTYYKRCNEPQWYRP